MKLNNEPNNWASEREPLGTTIGKTVGKGASEVMRV